MRKAKDGYRKDAVKVGTYGKDLNTGKSVENSGISHRVTGTGTRISCMMTPFWNKPHLTTFCSGSQSYLGQIELTIRLKTFTIMETKSNLDAEKVGEIVGVESASNGRNCRT